MSNSLSILLRRSDVRGSRGSVPVPLCWGSGGALGCQQVQGTEGLWGSGGSRQPFALLFFNPVSWMKFVGKSSERKATGFGQGCTDQVIFGASHALGGTACRERRREPWGAALVFPPKGSQCCFSSGLSFGVAGARIAVLESVLRK